MAVEDFDQVTIEPAKLRPFSKFIMSIGELPTSYLDSLSYAEQVTWFCDYLQNNVIPAVNNNASALEEVQTLMTQLQEYVDNYFTNLDVQEEINNKLDQMAQDGSLYNIISSYTDPIIEEQNQRIEDIDNKVNAVANGSPLVASSTEEMTDEDRVYVNTTDGKWYYYDGDSWEIGGTYQATEVANNSITPEKTTFMDQFNLVPDIDYIYNKLLNYTTGDEQNFPGGSYCTKYIEIPAGKEKLVCIDDNNHGLHIYFYNSEFTFIEQFTGSYDGIITISENAQYFRIAFSSYLGTPGTKIYYYDDYIAGLNIYDNGSLKDTYNSLNSNTILLNNEKLNILPHVYNNTVVEPTINGNTLTYNFTFNSASPKYIGFGVNWKVKENDVLKIKVNEIGTTPTINSFALYPSNTANTNINTSGGSITNIYKNSGIYSLTITSAMINQMNNNTNFLTFMLPGTESSISYNFSITVQINDDYYYFMDLLNSFETEIAPTYKAMYLGDSITQLTGSRGWWTYTNEMLNITDYQNVAVVGARLTDYNDTEYDGNPVWNGPDNNHNNVLGNQVQKIINNSATYITPDFIFIAIGTNDGITTTLNDAYNEYFNNDGSIKSLDTVNRQTSAGAFRYCNEKLHELYPNAMIVWCTPIQAVNTTRNVKSIISWGDNLKLLCSIGSNYCIDTEKCGINAINEVSGGEGEDLIDGLHPNANGAKKIGTFNACEFKKFLDKIDMYQ